MVRVVLDANVLFPVVLRDVILEFSISGLLRVLWTDQVLAELSRALVRTSRHGEHSAAALISELKAFFPANFVVGYEHLTHDTHCSDPKDEHVLGAAIHSRADAISTFNMKDFPNDLFERFGIELIHPDLLLTGVFESNTGTACQTLGRILGKYNHPPKTVAELSARLIRSQVPRFGLRILDFEESINGFAKQVRASGSN
jgi:predicted nucleic acid-binding protein